MTWWPELGIGWFPVREQPYDAAYWERYRRMDRTPVGEKLTQARIDLVECFWNGDVIDVGIGGGRFVSEKRGAYGFDVNPHAVAWLRETGMGRDPYLGSDALCFWDSLEHIHNPAPLLAQCRVYVFVSCPVFSGPEHVLRSKHFRRDEHCWYFTPDGLGCFMKRFGFEECHRNSMEQALGREDIETFVFRRRYAQ